MSKRVFIALFLCIFAAAAFAQPAPPSCCAPIPPNLANWWTFDEPAGPTSSDFGGTFNNIGNDNGPVQRIPGRVGRAVLFNGTNTFIAVPNQAEIDFAGNCAGGVPTEDGTIDFWIRSGQNTGTVTILDKRVSSPLQGYSIYMWNGHIGIQFASNGSHVNLTAPNSVPAVATGQWVFVAITFTRCGTPTGTFYVNGQTASFSPPAGSIQNTAPLHIGRNISLGGAVPLKGALDELEYFKRALTKQQLDAIYNAGPYGKCRRYGD